MLLDFCKILFFYSLGGLFLNFINPGKVRNKFKYASYYLTIIHQGFVLPYYYILNFVKDSLKISKLMCVTTICYFIVDLVTNQSQIFKDLKFLMHHLITISLVSVGLLILNIEFKSYIVNALFSLEFGSLWLSVTDLFPTKLNYKLRFYLYVISRTITLIFLYECHKDIWGFKDNMYIFYGSLFFSLLLYSHNILIGYYLYKGMVKPRNG